MSYRIVVSRLAEKSLRRRVAPEHAGRIRQAIDDLAEDPRPPGCAKLRGREEWRVRVGDYRIVYGVSDDEQVVEILNVAHRRDVYR